VAAILSVACGTASVGAIANSVLSPDAVGNLIDSSSSDATTWKLVSLNGQPALSGVDVTAQFGADNRVTGSGGCNRYFGAAVVAGQKLSVGRMASTMMYCDGPGVMDQEHVYLGTLEKATVYKSAGDELQLGPPTGVVTLVFKR
jgi:heat shock protein HslJ